MRKVEQLTDNKFVNIKSIQDPKNHVNGYQFAERKGIDSVAFVCYDPRINKILLNNEYKPPKNRFILGAFGGSKDKDKDLIDIVIDEVKEEAGFIVSKDNIKLVGRSFVSTQMNQYCYLYLVTVDKEDQQEREPENAIEAMAETKWVNPSDINKLEDWKAITILAKSSDF